MKLTDIIVSQILERLDDEDGCTRICRNELAQEIGCVPSQVSYVVASRFTLERGFMVESKRGGGGFIRITRLYIAKESLLSQTFALIGEDIGENCAESILDRLYEEDFLTKELYEIFSVAIKDRTLSKVPVEIRGQVRACLLKNMLTGVGEDHLTYRGE